MNVSGTMWFMVQTGWTAQRWTAVFIEQAEMFRKAVVEADPAAQVPTRPGWTVQDLVIHLGRFLETSTPYLRTGSRTALRPPPPQAGLSPLEYLDLQITAAAEILTAVPGNRPVWTFSPAAPDLAWVWHRRIAHETVLRRFDAQTVVRGVVATDADLCADGIDEVLTTIVAAQLDGDVPNPVSGTATVRPTDVPESWLISLTEGEAPEVRAAAPGEEGDAQVTGEAELVYFWLWNRMNLKEMSGDRRVLDVLQVGRGH
ncbi:Mycothiol maleylpyruvate isomerase N-terminal domain-containing protein [Lentzea albida]|uniref:Mycothiol maleylpyruvate isomerase N-terminal domain-containing protein n=2 Tax=Lentzea albida TaxID=65499 RepID=A0A1H9NN15_9PSEU|nr:Mycothiol maleylpyruvate isomerase N-terminal domain-containing protein [Lentzea albida]